VEHLTYGVINPLFAVGMAALGDLLGLILATSALAKTGRVRRRLLVYAALAFGGSGIWAPTMVALLGFSVPPSVLRYAPEPVAVSFGIAILGVGAGLATACTGRVRFVRLLAGALIIGTAIVGTNVALIGSVRIGGTISMDGNLFAASIGAAMVTAGVTVGLLVAIRRLWVALVAAVLLALAATATHYLAVAAVRVQLGVEHTRIEGITPILLFASVILFSTTVLAMLWFFSVGTATRSDLRAIFAHPQHPIDIEPWMIEEVTSRIAAAEEPVAPAGRQPAPRPTPSISPLWRTVPTAALVANSRAGGGDRANARTPVPWVANPPVPVEPAAAARVSTVDDTDVHGLGAALINAARLTEAMDRAARERASAQPGDEDKTETADARPDPEAATNDAAPTPTSDAAPLPSRRGTPLPMRKPRESSPVAPQVDTAPEPPQAAEPVESAPTGGAAAATGGAAVATAVAARTAVAEATPVESEPSKGSRWRNRRR
jgi:NO-binding membrane sensor protein with MHYT domain